MMIAVVGVANQSAACNPFHILAKWAFPMCILLAFPMCVLPLLLLKCCFKPKSITQCAFEIPSKVGVSIVMFHYQVCVVTEYIHYVVMYLGNLIFPNFVLVSP